MIRVRVTELSQRPSGCFVEVAPLDNMGPGRLEFGPVPDVPPFVKAGAVLQLTLAELAEAPEPEPAEPKRRRKAEKKEHEHDAT